MKPKFVSIAGGTGSGKSSLCHALMDVYPFDINEMQKYADVVIDTEVLNQMDVFMQVDALCTNLL